MKRKKRLTRVLLSLGCVLGGGTMMANGCMNALASFPICGTLLTFCTPTDQLNLFFPLVKENFGPPNVFTLIATALAAYWPFVLMTFVSRVRDFPWRRDADDEGKAMFAPYLNVIRMHLLIFIFGGLYLLHLANLAIFPVLLFYFFPWRIFNRERKAQSQSQAQNALAGKILCSAVPTGL